MPRSKRTNDNTTAAEIEVKKNVRTTARKVKEKVEEAVGKATEIVSDTAAAAEIEAKKAAGKAKRAVKENKEKATVAVEEAKKPVRRARAAKLNIVIQSAMGGAITPEEIAAKVPKDATSVYVKVEENKIYWVGKDGETGAVDIWE